LPIFLRADRLLGRPRRHPPRRGPPPRLRPRGRRGRTGRDGGAVHRPPVAHRRLLRARPHRRPPRRTPRAAARRRRAGAPLPLNDRPLRVASRPPVADRTAPERTFEPCPPPSSPTRRRPRR